MSQPLRMHQIRRILELQSNGQSIRHTERLTGLSRNTIREYLRRIVAAGLDVRQALDLEEDSLAAIVYTDDIELPALVGVAREQRRVSSPTNEMNPPGPCWCCA